MKTSKEVRDQFVYAPSEVDSLLLDMWPRTSFVSIADIGACDGLSSVKYLTMWPRGVAMAFEPREDNCREAKQNFEDYGVASRVDLVQAALGSSEGRKQFHWSYGQAPGIDTWDTGNKSSSILKPKDHLSVHPWCKFRSAWVNVRMLDSFGQYFDFIHIDVQGAETDVFEGGRKMLRMAKAIFAEVSNREMYEGQPLKREVVEYLAQRGFDVRADLCGDQDSGDILFVRKPC